MKDWSLVSSSPEQTQRLGELLGQSCEKGVALLLEGDLGSGKTCFAQGVARGLGVAPQVPVNSPTYTLMNQYRGRVDVNHFDLYRLGSSDELVELDFDTYLHSDGVIIVEWAGMVEAHHVSGISIHLDYGATENDRTLRFVALDRRGEAIIDKLKNEWKEL